MLCIPRPVVVSVFCAALLGFWPGTPAAAQTLEIVHAFQTLPATPVGELLELAPNLYLGASRRGGAYDRGTVYALFRLADGTWKSFVVHSFTKEEGTPAAGVMRASNGSFYGTTENGGRFGNGTVYRISAAGVFSTLHHFNDQIDGRWPLAPLVEGPDGLLWGATASGGSIGDGTIFKITPAGARTIVHHFQSLATGTLLSTALVRGGDGLLYGVTNAGGDAFNSDGVAFRITTGGTLTVLHRFTENEFGPKWIRRGIDGNIYGVTHQGGRFNSIGTFFRISPDGVVSRIRDFTPTEPGDVWYPTGAPVQAADGGFYGIGDGHRLPTPDFGGAVYRMSLTEKPREIATFGGSLGRTGTGLIPTSDGAFVGTTQTGERPTASNPFDGLGAAYRVDASGSIAPIYAFGQTGAQLPAGRLTEGRDGRLYGTSCLGGVYNRGTVYRLDSTGPTTLHSFTRDDGECPISGVTAAADGAFYGTTLLGGGTLGRIFKMTVDSVVTELWRPPSEYDLRLPFAAPVAGADGALYVTASGILAGYGAVLRIDTDGNVTTFAAFEDSAAGGTPASPLTLASDGNLYGTTSIGNGGVYRISPAGTLAWVHTFTTAAGIAHRGGVIQGHDGRLYGSGSVDGSTGLGRVYALTLDGALSVLHDFQGSDGLFPWGELLEASPGRFFGVTIGLINPGLGQFGSIFEVSADGGFRTVHRFSHTDGANPFATLMRASDGAIYGTASRGGPLGGGVIFRIVPAGSR